MVGCATDTRTRRQASAVDCVRGRLSVLVSRVCVCHQPIPHDARECIVGLRSAAVTPIAPPSVVCRVSDVGARLRLVWAASAVILLLLLPRVREPGGGTLANSL